MRFFLSKIFGIAVQLKNIIKKPFLLTPVFFYFISLTHQPLWAQSVNLPLDHWGYAFLDRLETRGLFESEDFNMRPFSRQAIAEIIVQVNNRRKQDSGLFSAAEMGLFEQLKGEFEDELGKIAPEINIRKQDKERHMFSWRPEELTIHFEGILEQQFKFENKEKVESGIPLSISTVRIQSRVNIKESMGIFVDGRSHVLSEIDSLANTVFNPALGLPVTEDAFVGITVTDNVASYMKFKLPWFELMLGRDLVDWGPGYRGHLLISRNSNNYDLIKMTFRYKKAKLEYFHGFLNADKSKYIAAHRLEIRPSQSWRFAISESVIYGDRDVEPLYLNPFVPMIISERHVGNKDNNMIGLDATWFVKKHNLKLYAEVLFDDFSLTKDIFAHWQNKWAVLFGGYWVNPFKLKDVDFRFELMRIQPVVYSHFKPINSYSNYNSIIGHWLGPDADDWYVELAKQFHKNLKIGVYIENKRKAENDIRKGDMPEDLHVVFLDGIVERQRYFGLEAKWQLFRDVFLSTNYQYIQAKNLARIENKDQNNQRLFVNFYMNY